MIAKIVLKVISDLSSACLSQTLGSSKTRFPLELKTQKMLVITRHSLVLMSQRNLKMSRPRIKEVTLKFLESKLTNKVYSSCHSIRKCFFLEYKRMKLKSYVSLNQRQLKLKNLSKLLSRTLTLTKT